MLEKFHEKLKKDGSLYLRVKVSPGAPATGLKQVMFDDTLKVGVKAKAERGKANRELLAFLAEEFSVGAANIKVISGASDRLKIVKLLK